VVRFCSYLFSKRLPSEAGRSASPISESGVLSDEKGNGKGKANPKGGNYSDFLLRDICLIFFVADESEFTLNGNGKRKRASISPANPSICASDVNT